MTTDKAIGIAEKAVDKVEGLEAENEALKKKVAELECLDKTRDHIEMVRKFLRLVIERLHNRGVVHDHTKLEEPELSLFAKMTPRLASLTYGSKEYEDSLKELKPALDHHYAHCRHHLEHFKDGINDMNLVDLVEMICDWKAATVRQNNGNILTSIEKNARRYNIDQQLVKILVNTVKLFEQP